MDTPEDQRETRNFHASATLTGRSPEIVRARERVAALAPLMAPVLLLGERGSGRHWVAAHLHRSGPLRDAPFLTLHCDRAAPTALPEAGVVHLEGVELLLPPQQALWRRALERRSRSGEAARIRLLTSSELRLTSLRAAGVPFDAELAQRLGRFEVRLPPLRERLGDLPALTRILLRGVSEHLGRHDVRLDEEALDALAAHTWPGNLAELEQVLEELVAYSAEGRITRASVAALLAERAAPLVAIAAERGRAERAELLALYREHGSFAGVARALGVTRNAAKYRFAKHGLLPAPGAGRR
ncbi:MAG: sigma 54-interacting transcriptional regulator [Deltaproteobacteria bacterium]|nr:sigma 54-interacting transcriptional regulator [Deltaproteobacteria bacterium]MBW2419692.1 sigma 54-interacting transcriptional regulator [Deltaproteobacteria bacterium]